MALKTKEVDERYEKKSFPDDRFSSLYDVDGFAVGRMRRKIGSIRFPSRDGGISGKELHVCCGIAF